MFRCNGECTAARVKVLLQMSTSSIYYDDEQLLFYGKNINTYTAPTRSISGSHASSVSVTLHVGDHRAGDYNSVLQLEK